MLKTPQQFLGLVLTTISLQIGFIPNGSAFNLTARWAAYLSLYALIGEDAKVPFPGTKSAWTSLYNEASSDIIAKFSLWAALTPRRPAVDSCSISLT